MFYVPLQWAQYVISIVTLLCVVFVSTNSFHSRRNPKSATCSTRSIRHSRRSAVATSMRRTSRCDAIVVRVICCARDVLACMRWWCAQRSETVWKLWQSGSVRMTMYACLGYLEGLIFMFESASVVLCDHSQSISKRPLFSREAGLFICYDFIVSITAVEVNRQIWDRKRDTRDSYHRCIVDLQKWINVRFLSQGLSCAQGAGILSGTDVGG